MKKNILILLAVLVLAGGSYYIFGSSGGGLFQGRLVLDQEQNQEEPINSEFDEEQSNEEPVKSGREVVEVSSEECAGEELKLVDFPGIVSNSKMGLENKNFYGYKVEDFFQNAEEFKLLSQAPKNGCVVKYKEGSDEESFKIGFKMPEYIGDKPVMASLLYCKINNTISQQFTNCGFLNGKTYDKSANGKGQFFSVSQGQLADIFKEKNPTDGKLNFRIVIGEAVHLDSSSPLLDYTGPFDMSLYGYTSIATKQYFTYSLEEAE